MVRYLHQHGANIQFDNNYAFTYAATLGHYEIVRFLYENGDDILLPIYDIHNQRIAEYIAAKKWLIQNTYQLQRLAAKVYVKH